MKVQVEKSDDSVISLIFASENKEIVDIDQILVDTNINFIKLVISLGLPVDFNFKNRDNIRLYTNEFIHTFVEFIKNRNRSEKLYIYSNISSKDDFRNKLVRKLKTMFGFNLLELQFDMNALYNKLEIGDCDVVTTVECFLNSDRKCKSYRYIKRYFEKNGYKFLNDTYFKDFTNKLCLFI